MVVSHCQSNSILNYIYRLEAIVDQDDVKKVDGEFEIESKYMDPTIMADVILKK